MKTRKLDISLDSEIILKGLLAVLIIFSHSSIAENIKIADISFNNLNYYFVAIFFFLSGFGLALKEKNNKPLNIIKKVLYLIIPYFIICIIYTLLFGKCFSIKNLYDIFTFNKIAPYCWYVKAQILLYIIWWVNLKLTYKYGISKSIINYIFIFTFILLYAIYNYYNQITSTTYITVFNFLIGIIYAIEIYGKIDKKKFVVLEIILLLISLLLFFLFPRKEIIYSYIIINITTGIFSIFIIQLLYYIKIKNKFLIFIGSISYYLYISQCIAQCIFQKTYFCSMPYFSIQNNMVILIFTIFMDLVISLVLKLLIDFMTRFMEKVLGRQL